MPFPGIDPTTPTDTVSQTIGRYPGAIADKKNPLMSGQLSSRIGGQLTGVGDTWSLFPTSKTCDDNRLQPVQMR